MTSDMIREHQQVLACVGTSDEAAMIRARMQTAALKSDMQAFKAANPGCDIADFIRWYSPRDWVALDEGEESQYKCARGKLSKRMSVTDNLWFTTWNAAEA